MACDVRNHRLYDVHGLLCLQDPRLFSDEKLSGLGFIRRRVWGGFGVVWGLLLGAVKAFQHAFAACFDQDTGFSRSSGASKAGNA